MVLTLLIIFLLCVFLLYQKSSYKRIRSVDGTKLLPHACEDTRFTRFSEGKQLSTKLQSTLGPIYTMTNGRGAELVLSTPVCYSQNSVLTQDHVRTVYERQSKVQ